MDGAGGRAIAVNGDSPDRGCRDWDCRDGGCRRGLPAGVAGGGDRVFWPRAEPWHLAGNSPAATRAWGHQNATPNCGSRTVRLRRPHRCVSSATPRRARSGDRHRDRRVAAAGRASRSHREGRGGERWLAIHPGPGTASTSAGTASAATSAAASATSATSAATPAGQEGVGEDVADGGEERGH